MRTPSSVKVRAREMNDSEAESLYLQTKEN
jgi:hypothetical protein